MNAYYGRFLERAPSCIIRVVCSLKGCSHAVPVLRVIKVTCFPRILIEKQHMNTELQVLYAT